MKNKEQRHAWSNALEKLFRRNAGLKIVDNREKLEYYRQDLNADIPPIIRDLLLKSLPDLILQPTTEENLLEIFAFARENNIPLTIRGAGTWGYGGSVPVSGGFLIDLGLMNTIQVDDEACRLTAGPGARFVEIERELERHGLTLLSMPSGKGGTLIGWMATGGIGLGTYRHGPVRDQLFSIRVVTPDGKIKKLESEDPNIVYFLSTEGQMGIIVEATLRVTPRPARWYPFVIPFEELSGAYAFVQQIALQPSLSPEAVVVHHCDYIRALRTQSNGRMSVEDRDMVLVAFTHDEEAQEFEAYLDEHGIHPADAESASYIWEERFFPMSIKRLGPSLLANEVILPLDQVVPYNEKITEWGRRLGITLYSTSHLINPGRVLFLALLTTDHRKTIFYADLMLIPMMLRLAIQHYGGKPYGLGVWNTPFLRDLYPKEELNHLVRYKKKVDPAGILNPGKFFGFSESFGPLQRTLFNSGIFNLGLSAGQWLLFKLFSIIPAETLRMRVPVIPQGLEEISNDILSCAQCGNCVARCPVYRATGDETLTAKGKLLTIQRALETGKLELSNVLPFYFCMRCGRCDDECQVHLKHRHLFDELEKYLARYVDFPLQEVARFIREVENSPEFSSFLEVIRTGFDQKIREHRNTFPVYRVTIDDEHCIHCGTCVDACIYGVRKRSETDPRLVLVDDEMLCRGCGACLERCPQIADGFPATSVEMHPHFLTIDDPYWTAEVITHIDLEATTGCIPISGTGQGDPHRGFGNDGIRFGHFHIVGPAQNLLYESTADAVAIHLGRRSKYCEFNGDRLETPAPRLVGLKTPIILDVMPMHVGEELLAPMMDAAEEMGTRVTLRLEDIERCELITAERIKALIPRFTFDEIKRLLNGKQLPGALQDRPPEMVEIELNDGSLEWTNKLHDLFRGSTVLCAVLTIGKKHVDTELRPAPALQKKLEYLLQSPFDVLCITSDYDPEKGYYPTTDAVPAVHRFLVDQKLRHRFSILASGGIRSAADAQKTVQLGANGIKIDWPVLLTVDPLARQRFLKGETIDVWRDPPTLAKRIATLIRVWNIQIIEVLGASGFKDIKKTVGEENRLLIFDELEERVYDIFASARCQERNRRCNTARIHREGDLSSHGWRHSQLQSMVRPATPPHQFYDLNLKDSCYCIFNRDHVWPASLITSVGRMASGDRQALLLAHTEERGNLGDGFDAMNVRFQQNPDNIPGERLEEVSTALQISPELRIRGPFIGAGMSVGSIGSETWRARVLATRALGSQLDTGEGGYPTIFILDSDWNPLEVNEKHAAMLGQLMEERTLIPIGDLIQQVRQKGEESSEYRAILEILSRYPASMQVQFVPIVTHEDEPYISTELKTGLFGVTKDSIRRARRVVIAYSQGAKQGIGGHLLGGKVFGLVSMLRGVAEGVSLISPFPFHNCYSIEDVKAFIDAVRMMNRQAEICIKVSPSPDIEFIVSGLARIAKDNRMIIEVWLDGPRGGTGAAPDIIKGQMGMHMEYAIPICHEKLMNDGLRDHVVFMGSGGFRTWGDVIKGVALGLDGVILGTADLVAIGCVRDRNCESGCRSGISTSEPKMQVLRDVELNTRQIINYRAILQAQVIRALAGLGMNDIRELRGRYNCVEWPLLDKRVRDRRYRRKHASDSVKDEASAESAGAQHKAATPIQAPSDCGVAAVVSNRFIPSHVMDLMLERMANRGMDGVGIWKGGCYPGRMDHYAVHVLIKGVLQPDVERRIMADEPGISPEETRRPARQEVLAQRRRMMHDILEKYFKGLQLDDFDGDVEKCRIPYRTDEKGQELDFRCFGEKDPGDVFKFFVRVHREELRRFVENHLLNDPIWPPRQIRYRHVNAQNYRDHEEFLNEAEDEYIYRLARTITRENYSETPVKKAAVMSCGKNSGCWKSDGRHIPWELPDAPVNVIHRRLATGSVVDQMNAHPFAELHTALTHNGETTNYRTMVNRVQQFDLTPLAQTDTAVASLKLHLLSQYLRYPFDALVEAFSPTTGWHLTQLPPEIRERFKRVQEVELESAPDGPYQYLCGRIDPYRRVIERLDIIDPSLLRPNVAMLYDDGENFVSVICSEKQGSDAGMQELNRLGIVRSSIPPLIFTVTTGMLSRVYYDREGKITGHEVLDKFGQPVNIPRDSFPATDRDHAAGGGVIFDAESNLVGHMRDRLPRWGFGEFDSALAHVARSLSPVSAVEELTRIHDHLAGWETGGKDRGSLIHIARRHLYELLDGLDGTCNGGNRMVRITAADAGKLEPPGSKGQMLVVDARGFEPEGVDPLRVLSCFLDHAHGMGWRRFIVYRAGGQRGIAMGMGRGATPDVRVDIHGSPGEYCGAFNMGSLVRVHGHAQNFTGMVMHSGTLEIHGDVGKVAGYAAKGGVFNILGSAVDRGWVCAVSDPRGQALEVNLVGTACEHLCQALMGGSVMVLGLIRGSDGILRRMPSPYDGAKILAGASAGEAVFYDSLGKLEKAQYEGCIMRPLSDSKWEEITGRLMRLEDAFSLGIRKEKGRLTASIDGLQQEILPEHFRWLLPVVELEGYY